MDSCLQLRFVESDQKNKSEEFIDGNGKDRKSAKDAAIVSACSGPKGFSVIYHSGLKDCGGTGADLTGDDSGFSALLRGPFRVVVHFPGRALPGTPRSRKLRTICAGSLHGLEYRRFFPLPKTVQ